ncbi:hypothetical protein [Clostridium botulinum]|nr:hypothetical protein [Clostridium botulinum]
MTSINHIDQNLNWIKNYRRDKKLELFTVTDVKNYKISCIRSIKEYKNN